MACVGLKVLGNWVGKLTQLRNIHVLLCLSGPTHVHSTRMSFAHTGHVPLSLPFSHSSGLSGFPAVYKTLHPSPGKHAYG